MMRAKNVLFILAVLFSGASVRGQGAHRSTVTGKLRFVAQENRVLQLTYRKISGGYQFDSAAVINGQFRFEKEISEPIIAIISLKPLATTAAGKGVYDYLSLLLLPGKNLQLDASSDLRTASITGTGAAINQEYKDYEEQLNFYIEKSNRALGSLQDLHLDSAQKEQRITQIQDSFNLERDQQLYLKAIETKPQSPIAALALLSYAGEPVWRPRKKIVPEEIESLLALLPKKTRSYPSLKSLKEELAVSKATGYGKPIIDFALEDTSGKLVRLSDFKGKYVFLDFWASWCVPCRKENPNVKRQFEKYKDKGFTVVSVSLDKPGARQAWLNAIRRDGVGIWTQLGDLHGFDGPVAKSYYVRSIPTNFLIDRDGKFIARNLYGKFLSEELAKLFRD